MSGDLRMTAYWYASTRGLPCDLESLRGLGLAAARAARWHGIAAWKVPEGPYRVHAWPAAVWDEVTDAFRDDAPWTLEVIPPGVPLPCGDMALRAIGY